jgi:small subunit ribosomal protein S21
VRFSLARECDAIGKRRGWEKPFLCRETFLAFHGNWVILNAAQSGRFGGVFALAEIRVQEGEPLENALRRFKRKVQTEDIIKEVKRHSFYLKPGEKKRVKEALARKRNRKKVRKEQD